MPLTDEQVAEYRDHPERLRGTWWWYLRRPTEPALFIVRDVEPTELLVEEVTWDGAELHSVASARWVERRDIFSDYSAWWLLGGDWLAVFLRPNTPVLNQTNPDLRATITRVGTTVSFEDATGTAGGTLSLYDFLHTWEPGILVTDDGFDVPFPEIPEGTSSIEGKSQPFAPLPEMATTRFERDPLKD